MKANHPDLWRSALPQRRATDHKYDRGYACIFGAPRLTGATRLAAMAAGRVGTGLVGILARGEPGWALRACLPPDILVTADLPDKATALAGGSGGITPEHRELILHDGRPRLLDADLLDRTLSFEALTENDILTPHAGEFARLFPDLDPETEADAAARRAGCVIICKGPRTHIVGADGQTVLHDRPNRDLAKAGTGDVLSGIVVGLLAQGMPAFYAACAGVWIHTRAAELAGPYLTASDLIWSLRATLIELTDD